MENFREYLQESFIQTQQGNAELLDAVADLRAASLGVLDAVLMDSNTTLRRRRQLQLAQSETRLARHECRRTEQQLTEVEERRDVGADRLDQMQRAASSALSELENKAANYQKAAMMLRTCMGVTVRKRSTADPTSTVRVITLTRLDQSDPERPYHIQYATEGDGFRLMTTKPSIGDLSELQAHLDGGGDLGVCICRIRSRFQQVAAACAARRQRRAARGAT